MNNSAPFRKAIGRIELELDEKDAAIIVCSLLVTNGIFATPADRVMEIVEESVAQQIMAGAALLSTHDVVVHPDSEKAQRYDEDILRRQQRIHDTLRDWLTTLAVLRAVEENKDAEADKDNLGSSRDQRPGARDGDPDHREGSGAV